MIDKLKQTQENNDVQTLAHQIKDKIKAKETEIQNSISYSVGKGNREVVILAQPLQQETTIEDGIKTRGAKRTRYVIVSHNGIGAVDFITAVKFDASDNKPADSGNFGVTEQPHEYSADGEFVDISQHSTKNNDEGLLRNLRGLNGVDKMSPASGVLASVNILEHDNDGLGINNGQPVLSVGYDFQSDISLEVTEAEFLQALKLSEERSRPAETKVEPKSQGTILANILKQIS